MFNDPELPVQRYTVPFKVNRQALNEYMTKSHDYLCERSWWKMNTEEKVTLKEVLGCVLVGTIFATMFVLRIIF